jgi:Tat protein secretion system quality control protein TatD with DNase activity
VPLVGAAVAAAKGVDVAEVARATSATAERLFAFPPS